MAAFCSLASLFLPSPFTFTHFNHQSNVLAWQEQIFKKRFFVLQDNKDNKEQKNSLFFARAWKGSQVTALLLNKTRWTQKHSIFLKTFEFRHFIKTRVCEIDIPPWKLKVLINWQGIWVRNCLCRNWQATWETLHQLTKCETKYAKLDLFW